MRKIQVRYFLERTFGAKVEWCFDNVIKVNNHVIVLEPSKFVLGSDGHFYGTKRNILKALKQIGFYWTKKTLLRLHHC
jgi:hypothetical protein